MFRHSLFAAFLFAPVLCAGAGLAQSSGVLSGQPAPAEEQFAGTKTLRGHYTAGEVAADWEAAMRDGRPEQIVEWRSRGEDERSSVAFSFRDGRLVRYAEQGRWRLVDSGVIRDVELDLSFAGGQYARGLKTIDGQPVEPDPEDIRAAVSAAQASLGRIGSGEPVPWQTTPEPAQQALPSVSF